MADLKALADSIIKGDHTAALALTRSAVDEGMVPDSILEDGLIAGMNVVGSRFRENEIFVPEVLISARAMKMAMEILEPVLTESGSKLYGKVLIGTVKGDLHDIGKNLVVMMLKGSGFDVVDLGIDVPAEKFVEQARETSAQVVGLSALLTTTMPEMEKIIQALRSAGTSAKIVIGGAPLTQNFADKIGADGYADDASSAVDLVRNLIT